MSSIFGWLADWEVRCWMFLFLTHVLVLILFISWYFLLLCFYSNPRTWYYGSLYMNTVKLGGGIEQLSVFFLSKIVIDYLGSNTPIPSLFQLQKQLLHCACLSICQINTTKVVQSCSTKMGRLCCEKRQIFLWLVKLTLNRLVRPKLKLYQNYLIYASFESP